MRRGGVGEVELWWREGSVQLARASSRQSMARTPDFAWLTDIPRVRAFRSRRGRIAHRLPRLHHLLLVRGREQLHEWRRGSSSAGSRLWERGNDTGDRPGSTGSRGSPLKLFLVRGERNDAPTWITDPSAGKDRGSVRHGFGLHSIMTHAGGRGAAECRFKSVSLHLPRRNGR